MQKAYSVSGIFTAFPVRQIKSVLLFSLILIINLNVSAQITATTLGGTFPNCLNSGGFILGQGAQITTYNNPLTGCGNDCGVRTPAVGGSNPAHLIFPAELMTSAGTAKCFSVFVFNANLNCNTNKNFPCGTYANAYIVPVNFSSNSAPLPGQYLGNKVVVMNTAYGSENCITIPFSVSNPDLTQQYRVLLDFTSSQTCLQPGTKYILDIIPSAPVFAINPDFNTTFTNVSVWGNLQTNDIIPAGSVYNTVPTLISSPAGSLPVLTLTGSGSYNFISDKEGKYTYDITVSYPNETNSTRRSRLVITVLKRGMLGNKPVANADLASTMINTPVIIKSLANDAAGNPGNELVTSSVSVITAPSNGTATSDPLTGNILYTPDNGFTGTDTLTYSVCDNQNPAGCATAVQIITVKSPVASNTTTAADDYTTVNYNTTGSGNVLTNDFDPQGDVQTVAPQNITITGKGTLVLNGDGSYVFTPAANFWGSVCFAYTVCDQRSVQACASATLFITVRAQGWSITGDYIETDRGIPVSGSIATNDTIPCGVTYGTAPAIVSVPPGAIYTLTLNASGSYTFISNTIGEHIFSVPVCVANEAPLCTNSTLFIRVRKPVGNNDVPVVWSDFAGTVISRGNATATPSKEIKLSYTAKTVYNAPIIAEVASSKVRIYPNPVSSELNVELPMSKPGVYEGFLYDAHGRQILHLQLRGGNNKINISGLAKGIYTLMLRNNGLQENTKIIVQ